jgi:hypothetical protein
MSYLDFNVLACLHFSLFVDCPPNAVLGNTLDESNVDRIPGSEVIKVGDQYLELQLLEEASNGLCFFVCLIMMVVFVCLILLVQVRPMNSKIPLKVARGDL